MAHVSITSRLSQDLAGEPALLPIPRVEEITDANRRTIFRWIAAGRLLAVKTHPDAKRGRTLVLKSSLIALLGGEA